MQKIFSEEVVRELGYQKEYPTTKEWISYFIIGIVGTFSIIGLLTILLYKLGIN